MTRDPRVQDHQRKDYRFTRVLKGLKAMGKAAGEDVDVTYPSSGKILTHQGRTRYAPKARPTPK